MSHACPNAAAAAAGPTPACLPCSMLIGVILGVASAKSFTTLLIALSLHQVLCLVGFEECYAAACRDWGWAPS